MGRALHRKQSIPIRSGSAKTPGTGIAAYVELGEADPRLVYMTDEPYRAAVCIHEAIHADYMESIGDVYVEFIPLPEDPYRYADAVVTNHKSESEDFVQMKADPLGYVKSILAGGTQRKS